MSPKPMSLLESMRRKFLMNSTYIMGKVGIKRFYAQEAEMSLTAMSSLESTRRKFFMKPLHHV